MLFKKNRGSNTPPLSPISRTDSIPTSDNDDINRLNRYDNNNGAIHYPSPPTSSGAKNYKRRIFPPSMHVMEQHHTVAPSRSSGVTITRKTLYVVTFLSFGSFVVLHTLYWNSVIVAITSAPNHQKNYDRISSNNRRILVSSDARITTKRKDASPHSPTFGGYSNPGQYETASFENDHSNDEPSKTQSNRKYSTGIYQRFGRDTVPSER